MIKNPSAKQGMWVKPLGWEDPLEKEMVTHLSILAWEVPLTEEPGRLSSMWFQRVGHDLATKKPEGYISSDWLIELAENGTARSDKSSGV